jgi:penicillin V acylase-like amidase (Ntn superfamily)
MEAALHRTRFLLLVLLLVAATGSLTFAGESQPTAIGSHRGGEHCTAMVLDNDGHTVFGANFDHTRTDEGLVFINKRGVVKSSVNTGTTGRRARWTTRYASISFNLVGYQYSWGGMNERGLSLSSMSLDETRQPREDPRPPLDSGEWVQYILDTCATIADVIATDSRVRIITVDHYLVADRYGNAVVIEFLDGRMVWHAAPNLPVAALTNNVYEESCATWERLRRHGNYTGQNSSPHRFCLAADRVDGFRPTSDARAVAYAFDTLDEVRGERFSVSPTNWSLVFDTKNLRAYYRTNRNYDIRWVDLKDLDLRCGAPVKMLDIHDGGAGDVADEFFDFDFDVNQDHVERFLDVWGVNLSHQSIMWILNHFDDFTCVRNRRSSPRRVMPVTHR